MHQPSVHEHVHEVAPATTVTPLMPDASRTMRSCARNESVITALSLHHVQATVLYNDKHAACTHMHMHVHVHVYMHNMYMCMYVHVML